jgi:hypothetical protein
LAVGCGNEPEPETPEIPEPEPPIEEPSSPFPPLAGTQWKLTGIVEASTVAVRELEPKDSYKLRFDTDSTAQGTTSTNIVGVNLGYNEHGSRIMTVETYAGENGPDAYVLSDFAKEIRSYEYRTIRSSEAGEQRELRFFNEKKDYYLLYKPIQP